MYVTILSPYEILKTDHPIILNIFGKNYRENKLQIHLDMYANKVTNKYSTSVPQLME